MRLVLFLILLGFPFMHSQAQQPQSAIKALLEKQTATWNQGNLDSFMSTYWQSDSLLFVGKRGPTYGWQATLNNYRKSYPDKAAMGTLTFNILEMKPLAQDVYFVVGKWHLQRVAGHLEGHFTLIIKQISGEWKIIADHSSKKKKTIP